MMIEAHKYTSSLKLDHLFWHKWFNRTWRKNVSFKYSNNPKAISDRESMIIRKRYMGLKVGGMS